MPAWLEQCGYRVGSFWAQDFTRFAPGRKFDLVASFGFIEHFTNWEEILAKHAALVDDKGCLVIEAPNFTGAFQHWLHSGFDQLNYARHHIPAMDIAKWAAFLQRSGFDITYRGYFGAATSDPDAAIDPGRVAHAAACAAPGPAAGSEGLCAVLRRDRHP